MGGLMVRGEAFDRLSFGGAEREMCDEYTLYFIRETLALLCVLFDLLYTTYYYRTVNSGLGD
jgi:hypothetical protein